jgi:hypothetical protein
LEDHTTNMAQKRLRILGDDEIQALYGRPHFTDDERLEYFALSPTEKASLEQGDRILSCPGEHRQQVVFVKTT